MKRSTYFKFLILVFFLFCNLSYTQTDEVNAVTNYTSKEKAEFDKLQNQKPDNTIPQYLLDQFANAKRTHNDTEKGRVGNEIEKYLSNVTTSTPIPGVVPLTFSNPPFDPDWYLNDVLVYNGDVASYGFRQIDLKQGEDGWMYLCVNRRNVSGWNGSCTVYRSTNGGATWSGVQGFNTTNYVQSVSMLVEKRHTSLNDSVRIIIYFTYAGATNWNGASVGFVTFLRNGTAWYNGTAGSPSSGNKFEYVSACSDGMYYTTNTYIHCLVREATNAGANVGLRHFLTQNWCSSHSNVLISTGWNDCNPSAQYGEKNSTTDSLYVATERRYSTSEYWLRVISIPEWTTSSNFFVYFVADASGVKFEKPELTVVQQYYAVPRKMLLTYTRAGNPRYGYSSNGAQTWTMDQLLGPNSTCQADFTTCNSDTLTSGGQYVIMGYTTSDGDSVNVKQLSIPPGTIFSYYKKNTNISSGVVAPSTSIYKTGNTKFAAFAYPGYGPTNVYYNAEHLVTGIKPPEQIPETFELEQNYPNPFNPVTTIGFSLPIREFVILTVYDILGNEVAVPVNEIKNAGTYEVSFNGSKLASGVYFYRLNAGTYSNVKKMILIK